jgi:hypothetical protein
MDLQLYIKNVDTDDYIQLDLFKDEKVELNLVVKNLSDISKIRSDFSQPFTIPCSPTNNQLFQYWYNSDVDGTFNANIRVDAYIEVNSLPFKYGSIQLDSCKLKAMQPYSYSVTFYGLGVNLSDKFSDDYLRDLPLSGYDHPYTESTVINSFNNYLSGQLYYPLINVRTYMDAGSNTDIDLYKSANTIEYKDFKPAIRDIKLIEAIESRYGVTFSRDFFDRSVFHNSYLWCHKEAGQMKITSDALAIDFTSKVTDIADWSVTTDEVNITSNSVTVDWLNNFPTGAPNNKKVDLRLRINTTSTNKYNLEIFDNGVLYKDYKGMQGSLWFNIFIKSVSQDDGQNHIFTYKVSTIEGNMSFTTSMIYTASFTNGGVLVRNITASGTTQTTANAFVKIKEQVPDIKVKDYFSSLINQYNLILRPTGQNSYHVDTLDNWYGQGKTYDITNLVDIKDVTVKRPTVKKRIDFLYQKTDTILGKQYYDNNQLSYGDLKATYNITGDELKIETQFENLMFEKLVDTATGTISDLNVGFSVDINNNPVKGKPIRFYQNGIETSHNVYIDGNTITKVFHTATEDNYTLEQVTCSMNFGADISTYFYSPIYTGLYYNFWKNYIEELYNKKTRLLTFKCKLPIRILQNFGLNDRFIIGEYKYKVSTLKVDLTTGDADIEVFSDLGTPVDSIDAIIPITVDSTEYTADNDYLTVDTTTIHLPFTSYVTNGVSLTDYTATKGYENFELKIDANTDWSLTTSNSWITTNKTNGKRSDYVRVTLSANAFSTRTGSITVTIGGDTFTINITQ